MGALLAIDAAGPRAGVAVLGADGTVLSRRVAEARTGLTETLPELLQTCLAEAKAKIEAVAVSIGPGSFTGLRNAISIAQGYAAASGAALLGVPVGDVFAAALPNLHRPLWVTVRARKGRIFIIRDGSAEAFSDADIPRPSLPIALAGDAANEVASRLAASGHDVLLTNARLIDPVWVGRAALSRHAANLPPHPAQPIYVDPPEAKQPAGGLRPQPV